MDFVHHLLLPHTHTHTQIPTYLLKNSTCSQNVVFSFEHEALDEVQKPNNPIRNIQCHNPFELNNIEFLFKVATSICCLTILQQRTVLINITIINIITWKQTQFCISGGEPSHSPWCPSHISDVPVTPLGFRVLHTEYETSSKTQSGDKS